MPRILTHGAAVEIGAAREIFQMSFAGNSFNSYDVTPDGKRFLVIAPEENARTAITLVTNWPPLLKKQ